MSVSRDEFEKKVWAAYPHKHMFLTNDPFDAGMVILALDSQAEIHLTYGHQLRLASHVWKDGKIIKDTSNLFSSPYAINIGNPTNGQATGNVTFTINHINPINWDLGHDVFLSPDGSIEDKSLKCICGSHSVGSKRHSGWCDIKGEG